MNLIGCKIKKSRISPFFICLLILLLNFCGIQSLAFSFECGPGSHYEDGEVLHADSHEENHSKDATDSLGEEEDPFCCATINAISITPKQNLEFDLSKNFSKFLDNSTYTLITKISQFANIWRSFHYLGPPSADRFKIVFFITSPTHAPPIPYTI